MPNRILREGILDSEAVNSLSFPAEVFYRRLMSVVDDFGRFDARPAILRVRLYPLQLERVTESDVSAWLQECERAGLCKVYTVDGKPYLLYPKLGKPRAKVSKYPPPPEALGVPREQTCEQTRAGESGRAHARPYSNSNSNSNSNSEQPPTEVACPEPLPAASGPAAPDPVVMTFPTVGNGPKEWHLTESKLAEYRASYPDLDVPAELRGARQWCVDNPPRRKTARGMPAFLTNWLNRAQNHPARRLGSPPRRALPPDPNGRGHGPDKPVGPPHRLGAPPGKYEGVGLRAGGPPFPEPARDPGAEVPPEQAP